MAKYKSFNTEKRKLQTSFNQQNDNRKNLIDLTKVNFDFRSSHVFKKNNLITLADTVIINQVFNNFTFTFENIPDWALNMLRPMVFFSAENGFDFTKSINNLNNAFALGQLNLGDISILGWNVHYWWVKLGISTYKFSIRTNVNVRFVDTLSGIGFTTAFLPMFLTIKLQFINERNYNELQ